MMCQLPKPPSRMNASFDLSRRRFIKTLFCGTVVSAAAGSTWTHRLLAEVKAVEGANVGTIHINLDDFPVLSAEGGSIQIGVNPIIDQRTADGDFAPILINRGPGNQFHALNSTCPHAGCFVGTFDLVDDYMTCPCHGSRFSIAGERTFGPAQSNLQSYPVTFDGQNRLAIRVPGLAYAVEVAAAGAAGQRLRLSFPTLFNVRYVVRLRQQLAAAPEAVSFALTPDGGLDQTVLIGDSQPASVYVAMTAASGFYTVEIEMLDLS